jgi:lipoprotein-anchoring transpeptidase ErfK/SrfK
MKLIFQLLIISAVITGLISFSGSAKSKPQKFIDPTNLSYWFLLNRKSDAEFLYFGKPGHSETSRLVRFFRVKSGIPGKRPTPLPQLLGREYWIITGMESSADNPDTAPYFLTLDVPVTDDAPFGPLNYFECNGQCNWGVPGRFGLHGVNGNPAKLSVQDPGSSGCVRHADRDITYLFNLLKPEKKEIRYYIEDK